MAKVSNLISTVLDLIFPPRCVFCRAVLKGREKEICPVCRKELPWAGGEEAKQAGEFFSLCVSPLWYRGNVRESFHRYKFKERTAYAKTYGALMARCVAAHLAGRYDLITWVPLSAEGLKKRGYDQAMLLAMAMALELGDVAAETLVKVRATQAQSGLTEDAARRANVLGAYEVRDAELVRGRRILLVDDVITTGATISEAARALRTAGADDVVCAALARARN